MNNAVEQAKNAASALLGNPVPYRLNPWFWSDQGDLRLQMVGFVGEEDDLVVRGEPSSEAFSVLHFRSGRLVGAQCVNRPADFMAVRGALGKGLTMPSARAGDITVPLKQLAMAQETALVS